ncbi:MAG: type VI-A CRISPR-associated RNA-guided ribonuclease Cas13a [Lachnospiraceae bacterium]|nr:type VI-A CRISPR-associated RNA-guided ribonuclease Cas13a [Lachnospiraceae bacterium]
MKISKVNNLRTAVTLSKPASKNKKNMKKDSINGILYKYPVDYAGKSEDLERHVKDRINSAKKLFKVIPNSKSFRLNKDDEDNKVIVKLARIIAEDFNEFMNDIITKFIANDRGGRDKDSIDRLISSFKNSKVPELKNSRYSIIHSELNSKKTDVIDFQQESNYINAAFRLIVPNGFKKSIGNKVNIDFVMKFFDYLYGKNRINENFEIDSNDLRTFLEIVCDDYFKEKERKNIVKSIRNKNMPVQVTNEGICVSYNSLSDANKSDLTKLNSSIRLNKKEENDAWNEIYDAYAEISQEKRNQILIHLRRLVLLYFYELNEAKNDLKDVWKSHEEKKKSEEKFISEEVDTEDCNKVVRLMRQKNMERFRDCYHIVTDVDLGFDNKYCNYAVLHFIESDVERIYKGFKPGQDFKLKKGYISEKVWKNLIRRLSEKYTAIGKGVYNFIVKDYLNQDYINIDFAKHKPEWENRVTSFVYEQIKAEETFQRELAVYVAFAVNNVSSEIIKRETNSEDFLLSRSKSELSNMVKDDTDVLRAILQYFGGKSTWTDSNGDESNRFKFENYYQADDSLDNHGIGLLWDIKTALYGLRNSSFHFTTNTNEQSKIKPSDIFVEMLKFELSKSSIIIRKKFYSNNLDVFYSSSDLKSIMDYMYSSYHERNAMIPAFNNVMKKKDFHNSLVKHSFICTLGEEDVAKWEAALYYLFKEIYYNCFIQDENTFGRFLKVMGKVSDEDKKNKEAFRDFSDRVNDLKSNVPSLAGLCQVLLTDFNQQNTGRYVKTSKQQKKNSDKYGHYKMLLYSLLQLTFFDYLEEESKNDNSNVFGFLMKKVTSIREKEELDNFIPDWNPKLFDGFTDEIVNEPELQSWYVLGKFINTKQLNLLSGSLKQYVTYLQDIKNRAGRYKGKLLFDSEDKIRYFNKVIMMVDICIKFSGNVSNELNDYFESEEKYAEYLSNYIDYINENDMDNYGLSYATQLKTFCSKGIEIAVKEEDISKPELKKQNVKVEIYYNEGGKPILNRNVVISKIFGCSEILNEVYKIKTEDGKYKHKVSLNEIKDFYEKNASLDEYIKTNRCKTKEEQENLKKYQAQKNHIEMQYLVEVSEIIFELYGQLINWCYLRERDLMYFQLGFHYTLLKGKRGNIFLEGYDEVGIKDGKIKGLILYQIVALYTFGNPLFKKSNESSGEVIWELSKQNASTGGNISHFLKIYDEANGSKTGENIYLAGLELFENIKEHDNMVVDIRNYLVHFKYFMKRDESKNDRSLLDLYSEMFDRFLGYDERYRKNVIGMLENTLKKHFIIPRFEFLDNGVKRVGKKDSKKCAAIGVESLKSEMFKYSLDSKDNDNNEKPKKNKNSGKGKKNIVFLPAKSNDFLELVAECLVYNKKIKNPQE